MKRFLIVVLAASVIGALVGYALIDVFGLGGARNQMAQVVQQGESAFEKIFGLWLASLAATLASLAGWLATSGMARKKS